MSCLQEFTFLNVSLTTWMMLHFKNYFGVIISRSGRVRILLAIYGPDRVEKLVGRVTDNVHVDISENDTVFALARSYYQSSDTNVLVCTKLDLRERVQVVVPVRTGA